MIRPQLEAEVKRLTAKASRYGPETRWRQNEFSEILPFPKPLSLSVMRELAAHDGATGAACRELGLPYNADVQIEDYLETVFGRLYVNAAAEKLLNSLPSKRSFMKSLTASVKLEKENRSYFREFPSAVKKLDGYYAEQKGADVSALADRDLSARTGLLVQGLNDHYRLVVKAGIFANMNLESIASLAGKEDVADLIAADIKPLIKNNRDAEAIFACRDRELLKLVQFSAHDEYELACPRFSETGETVPSAPAHEAVRVKALPRNAKIRDAVLFFKIYESLKVIYKTMLLRELHLLRSALLEAGRRSGLGNDIFYLTLDELPGLPKKHPAALIAQRKELESVFRNVDLPTVVSITDIEQILHGTRKQEAHALKGVSVNRFEFEGKALIYRDDRDIERADQHTILVSRYASPNLVMAFMKVRGIITETGGLLSHLAIVAREQGFPLVLQVKDCTALIRNGATVVADEKGNILVRE